MSKVYDSPGNECREYYQYRHLKIDGRSIHNITQLTNLVFDNELRYCISNFNLRMVGSYSYISRITILQYQEHL